MAITLPWLRQSGPWVEHANLHCLPHFASGTISRSPPFSATQPSPAAPRHAHGATGKQRCPLQPLNNEDEDTRCQTPQGHSGTRVCMCTHMRLPNKKRSATQPSAAAASPTGPEMPACSGGGLSWAAASTQGSVPSHTKKAEAPESLSSSWEMSPERLWFASLELQSPQGATIQQET